MFILCLVYDKSKGARRHEPPKQGNRPPINNSGYFEKSTTHQGPNFVNPSGGFSPDIRGIPAPHPPLISPPFHPLFQNEQWYIWDVKMLNANLSKHCYWFFGVFYQRNCKKSPSLVFSYFLLLFTCIEIFMRRLSQNTQKVKNNILIS